MARIWSSGFELNTLTSQVEFNSVSDSGGLASISTTTVRSGAYSLKQTTNATNTTAIATTIGAAGSYKRWVRVYINIEQMPSAAATFFSVFSGATTRLRIRLETTGRLQFLNLNTQIGSDSDVLSTGVWYRIEMLYDSTPADGSEVGEARIDGVSFASASNLTIGDATGVRVGNTVGSANGAIYYLDDFAINDDTGSAQTSWPGDGKIIRLKPNGAGDETQADRGGADSGSNFGQTSEVTPNDDTDYIAINALNEMDTYEVESSGLSGSDTITMVAVGWRAGGSSGNSLNQISAVIRKATGGTLQTGTLYSEGLSLTNWATDAISQSSNAAKQHRLVTYQDPDASDWTSATLDTMQIGAKRTNHNTTSSNRITAIWALVEYVPSSGVTIVTQDIAIGLTTDNDTITQDHIVATNDVAVSLTEDADTIAQNHIVATQDVAVSLTEDVATITQDHVLTVQDMAISLTEDNATINQNHLLTAQDVAVGLTEDATTIEESYNIVTQDIAVSLSVDNTSITTDAPVVLPYRLLRGARGVLRGPRTYRGPRRTR